MQADLFLYILIFSYPVLLFYIATFRICSCIAA